MITKWKLANFKSIRDDTELRLSPLTIFAGANSAGKSSWIQSILLISQTLSSKVSSKSVVLNGHLARLGQFDDLKCNESKDPLITIGWECSPSNSAERPEALDRGPRDPVSYSDGEGIEGVSCTISFGIDTSSPSSELLQLQPRLQSCKIRSCVRAEEDEPEAQAEEHWLDVVRVPDNVGNFSSRLANLEIASPISDANRASLNYSVELDEFSQRVVREDLMTAEPVGCSFRHFLPSRITLRYDEVEEEARLLVAALTGERIRYRHRRHLEAKDIQLPPAAVALINNRLADIQLKFPDAWRSQLSLFQDDRFTLASWMESLRRLPYAAQAKVRHALQDISDDLYKVIKSDGPRRYSLASAAPGALVEAVDYLDEYFSTYVRYLGPLRDEPKPLYPLALTGDPSEIGLRGEFTAAVLDLHKDRYVKYIPTSRFFDSGVKPDFTWSTLQAAIHDWLEYLGVASRVETRDRGKLGHELKVIPSGSDKPQDLTHVGVGVSQVLPILVMCLLAEGDTVLIIEQPELHLHPRVQTRLGDFFLAMALLGKQCILETHSEYLINRLRLRAANGSRDDFSSLMTLYFVEMAGRRSVYREVAINKYGAIEEWPQGFFDQGQREAEAILRAGIAKRKKERQGNL